MPRKRLSLIKIGSKAELSDVLKLVFGLSNPEINVLFFLMNSERCQCIKSLKDHFEKNRTTIQRNLNKLLKFRLIQRSKKTYKEFMELCREHNMVEYKPEYERGYLYVYKSIPTTDLKNRLSSAVESSFNEITQIIEQF